ncbi:MAG: hypothetical protein ACFFCW_06490 [Candidatus Hodarchaeota archaeon]
MGSIREKIATFKDRLVKINDREPLSKLSLVVIIALDLFILILIFRGLSDHTGQLTSPYDYIPYECRRIFIEKKWSEANKIEGLQELVLIDYNNYSYRYYKESFEKTKLDKMHPLCKKFFEKVKIVAENKELSNLFIKRQKLVNDKKNLTASFKQSKDVYDTSLLEEIARNNKDITKLPSISDSIKHKENTLEQLNVSISKIDKRINDHRLIKELWPLIEPEQNDYRNTLVNDLNKFEFWYPLKEFAWQLIFMLPLFIIFYIWNSRSIYRNKNLQILISSHLLIIASIPIIIKTMDVVLHLIPRHFFRELFKLLELFHIIALWHYLLIIISIFIAIFFIYIVQKKIFDEQRLIKKRLLKGACYVCGKKLPNGVVACPFCGTKQYKTCPVCNKNTFITGDYCTNCGDNLK